MPENSPATKPIKLTHPDRVIDATTGLTKGDLAAYYRRVADLLLPFVVGRPLALVRCPDGAHAKCFFQKQRAAGMPGSIRETRVGRNPVLYIDDAEGLLSLVQFGTIELHPWGSKLDDVHRPDWLVVDLDPAPDVEWSRTVSAAESVRGLFREIGLESFVRTTGGKGLHVVAPITPSVDYADARQLTRSLSERLVRSEPSRYTVDASKPQRSGKVFVDYLRNGEGATSIAPYSARARPGSPVAFPIAWDEVRKVNPLAFTVSTVPSLLSRRKKDPWGDFFELSQSLPQTLPGRVSTESPRARPAPSSPRPLNRKKRTTKTVARVRKRGGSARGRSL